MTIPILISISIFFKSVDISTIDMSYRYIEQGYLLLDKDRIISVKSAAVVLGQIRLPEGEEGALGMSSTSSLASLTG